jgi:hypothetical protein
VLQNISISKRQVYSCLLFKVYDLVLVGRILLIWCCSYQFVVGPSRTWGTTLVFIWFNSKLYLYLKSILTNNSQWVLIRAKMVVGEFWFDDKWFSTSFSSTSLRFHFVSVPTWARSFIKVEKLSSSVQFEDVDVFRYKKNGPKKICEFYHKIYF